MEFEAAAQRLARDQSKLAKNRRDNRIVSQKAKRQADHRKQQQELLRIERQRKQQQDEYRQSYMKSCERTLGIQTLKEAFGGNEYLWNWRQDCLATVRIAAFDRTTNYHYHYYQCITMDISSGNFKRQVYISLVTTASNHATSSRTTTTDDDNMEMDSDDDNETDNDNNKAAYLDELSHKYLSYTYASVVEFTQEEGHIGLPASIASRLLVDGVSVYKNHGSSCIQ